jgi:hypothetical protein
MTSQRVGSMALDPLGHPSMETSRETNHDVLPGGITSSSIDDNPTQAPASTNPMPRRDIPTEKMIVCKATSAKDVIDQHNMELLSKYPVEIEAGYHDHQGNNYDLTMDSCISSITRELPDIYSESMYPTPDKVREALLEPILEGADAAAHDSRMTSANLTRSSFVEEANEKQNRVQIQSEVSFGGLPEEPSVASSAKGATAVSQGGSACSSLHSLEHLIHAKAAGVVDVKDHDISAKSSNKEMEPMVIPSGLAIGVPSPLPVPSEFQVEAHARVAVGLGLAERHSHESDHEAPLEIMHDTSAATVDVPFRANDDDDPEQADSILAQARPVSADQSDLQMAESVQDVQINPKSRRRRQILYAGAYIGCVALFIFVVVVVVVTTKSSANSDSVNSLAEKRTRVGEEITIHLEAILGYEFFQKDASQSKESALKWLVFDDPLQLNRSDPNLLQRFLLAYFYQTMTVKGPWRGCNPTVHKARTFQNNTDLCHYEGLLGDGTFSTPGYELQYGKYAEVLATRWLTGTNECQWAGVFCDENNLLEKIHLGKFVNTLGPGLFLMPLASNHGYK